MAYLHQATLWHIPSFVEIQGSVLPWAIATVIQARLLGHLPDVGQSSLWVDIFSGDDDVGDAEKVPRYTVFCVGVQEI